MRGVRVLTGRVLTGGIGWRNDRPWLPGLPHAAAAMAACLVFGAQACLTGLLMATLASFVVYLPMTALALNQGRPLAADAAAPELTARAQIVLWALWTITAWVGAALAG